MTQTENVTDDELAALAVQIRETREALGKAKQEASMASGHVTTLENDLSGQIQRLRKLVVGLAYEGGRSDMRERQRTKVDREKQSLD